MRIRIRNKYHIIYFDNMDYLNIQTRYLINIYPDFCADRELVYIQKQVMSWAPRGRPWTGRAGSYPLPVFFGLENSTQIKFDKEEEYQRALDCLNEKFNVIL